jgi:perosamine synthetase
MELATEHKLTVIEDNAQCFLGYYKGRVVGSIGHFASFSFQASKHMTCGDGGILVCDDEELAVGARKAAVCGYSTLSARPGDSVVPEELRCHPTFQRHTTLGYNFRMPEIAAAAALGELERLDELISMRKAVAKCLDDVVRTCDWLVPQHTPEDYVHSYWTYTVRIARDGVDWAAFRKRFVELGGDGFYGAYLPVHREPALTRLSQAVRKHPERYPHWADVLPDYGEVSCPVWDSIQPRVIQFKTNYFDLDAARRQADILDRTIREFS